MQRNTSKEELREQVALVTMEIHKLQDKAQDLREVFTELNNVSVHHFIHLLLLLLSSSSSSFFSFKVDWA